MRVTQTKRDLSTGGGNFFKLGEGQTTTVRFLYKTVDDLIGDGLMVHVFKPENTGMQFNTEIMCGAKSDETAKQDCKWCASDNKPLARYPVALYNESTGRIEFWNITQSRLTKDILPVLENTIGADESISGKRFKLIRTGNGRDTKYTILPENAPNDGTQPTAFGEIVPSEERNCYKSTDYEFPVSTNGGATFGGGNPVQGNQGFNNGGNNFGNGNFQTTRRTSDVF